MGNLSPRVRSMAKHGRSRCFSVQFVPKPIKQRRRFSSWRRRRSSFQITSDASRLARECKPDIYISSLNQKDGQWHLSSNFSGLLAW